MLLWAQFYTAGGGAGGGVSLQNPGCELGFAAICLLGADSHFLATKISSRCRHQYPYKVFPASKIIYHMLLCVMRTFLPKILRENIRMHITQG